MVDVANKLQISEVKTFFNDNKKIYDDQFKRLAAKNEATGGGNHGIYYFSYPQATKAEILRSFPSKATTDVLMGRFFDIYNQDPTFR